MKCRRSNDLAEVVGVLVGVKPAVYMDIRSFYDKDGSTSDVDALIQGIGLKIKYVDSVRAIVSRHDEIIEAFEHILQAGQLDDLDDDGQLSSNGPLSRALQRRATHICCPD